MTARLIVLGAAMLLASAAQAEEGRGPYIAGSAVYSNYTYDDVQSSIGGVGYLGYRFGTLPLMVEASYRDLGRADIDSSSSISDASERFNGYTAALGYITPPAFYNARFWGKGGYYNFNNRLEFTATDGAGVARRFGGERRNGGGFVGIGGAWMITPIFGVRLDIESFFRVRDFSNDRSTVTNVSLGVQLAMPMDNKPILLSPPPAPLAETPPQRPPVIATTGLEPAPAPVLTTPATTPATMPETMPVTPSAYPPPVVYMPPAVAPRAPRPPPNRGGGMQARTYPGAVMRDQPTPNGPVTLTLQPGTPIDLISRTANSNGGWWFVNSAGLNGWIHESQLVMSP